MKWLNTGLLDKADSAIFDALYIGASPDELAAEIDANIMMEFQCPK
jgi:hypothetical protein